MFLNKFDDGFAPYMEIKSLAIKPRPTRIKIDSNGNMRAVYENFHAGGTLTVRQIALVESRNVKLVPGKPYQPDSNFKKYLLPSNLVESSHPLILKKAAQLTKGLKDPYDKARNIYAFVQTHMTYDENEKYANKGALSALNTGRGVCEDHSALMTALLRACGIPARQVGGYALNYEMKHVSNGERYILSDGSRWLEKDDGNTLFSNSRHGWMEFYLKGEGWVPADPTTVENKKAKVYPDWSTFGSLNPQWIYIPDSIGNTYSTSYHVKGKKPEIAGLVKIKAGYQTIGEDYFMVMSNTGKSQFPVPFYLPYTTISVKINGETQEFSPPAITKSGTALVPMRPLFEALGASVRYDGERKVVEGHRENIFVSLTLGSKRALVNGSPVDLGTAAQVIAGTVYVPAKFIGQALGGEVSWDESSRTVILQLQ